MPQKETNPAAEPSRPPSPGEVPINTDEQPAGRESGPLQSVDEKRQRERDTLVPEPQPEDNDV